MSIPKNFQEWACSLSGCDGGNINAKTWLCGIEWGIGKNDTTYYERLLKEIHQGVFTADEDLFDWKDSITYTYGRSFAKLYAAIRGEQTSDYYDLAHNKWNGSEVFKLNLYPIAFKSTNHDLWQKHDMEKITGFKEKHLFQIWCSLNRFPAFSKLVEEYKPELIIGTGTSYLRDFFLCFGGFNKRSEYIHQDTLNPVSEKNSGSKRPFFWYKVNDHTTLMVIPFFSGAHGLNSDALLQQMGNKIRRLKKFN